KSETLAVPWEAVDANRVFIGADSITLEANCHTDPRPARPAAGGAPDLTHVRICCVMRCGLIERSQTMNGTFTFRSVATLAGAFAALCVAALSAPLPAKAAEDSKEGLVPKWQRFEIPLQSSANYANPAQEATLTAAFLSPLGETNLVRGFWD